MIKSHTMRHTLLLLAFVALSATALQAQLGIRAGYNINTAPNWVIDGETDITTTNTDFLTNGYSYSIDYWIPLENYRIDFLPELNYGRFNDNPITSSQWFSFFLNTHFYFLDFQGDCNCPTFSKSGGAFQKGLFFNVSPGVTFQNNTLKEAGTEITEGDLSYSLGLGLGLDIGVSDFFTITPMISYRYHLPYQWDPLERYGSENVFVKDSESDIRQVFMGIRLGFRFDQRY